MSSFKKIIKVIQEDIIGSDNRVIAIAWLICLSGIVGLGFYMSSESTNFLGVADSRERQVSFEYPVEIKQIHVLPGQAVSKGELLLEMNQSELNTRLRLAKSALSKLEVEMKVRQHLNTIVSNSKSLDSVDPLNVDIEDLESEIEYLENQKKNLYVFSDVEGIVGAVNFRKGERVPSFTSVVTLSPRNPTYIDGFVNENLRTKLEIGKKVSVKSITSSSEIEGRIVSVGSRIIQIPMRLMHYPNAQVWGREVVIEIAPHNTLLLGEKVQIKPKLEIFGLPTAIAATEKVDTNALNLGEPLEIKMPGEILKRFAFEPSGVIYLEDLKKFLVISDDTDKHKSPTLFLVDSEGRLDDQFLVVPGLDKISDLESISQSGSYIYLLSSQGLNKKKKDKAERNLFVRVKRSGLDLSGTEKVELKPLLMKAIGASQEKTMMLVAAAIKDGDFEIESHFMDSGRLYLALKNPLINKTESVIFLIKDVDALFAKKQLSTDQLSVWKTLDFGSADGGPHHVSDLIKAQGRLFATTVCEDENCGAVWKIQEVGEKLIPKIVKSFSGLKPEGIAFDTSDNSLFVTFDQKQESAKFTRLSIQTVAPKKNEK